MTDFLRAGRIVQVPEPYLVLLVYGGFSDPVTKHNGILVRVPAKRWSAVKLRRALDQKLRGWDPKYRKPDWYWEGEGVIVEPGNFYKDGKTPIPPTVRLWDTRALTRYTWMNNRLRRMPRATPLPPR